MANILNALLTWLSNSPLAWDGWNWAGYCWGPRRDLYRNWAGYCGARDGICIGTGTGIQFQFQFNRNPNLTIYSKFFNGATKT